MRTRTRTAAAMLIAAVLVSMPASGGQGLGLHRVMHEKLDHAKAILEGVVTSDWSVIDRESRAMVRVTQDPAWSVLTAPEYLRQSDLFSRALQDLIQASARRDLSAAGNADVALTSSCVRCHEYVARHRTARLPPGDGREILQLVPVDGRPLHAKFTRVLDGHA
jgi:hypothetical protein